MKFTEFIELYGDSEDCKEKVKTTTFDPQVVSSTYFKKLFQTAIRLGLVEKDSTGFADVRPFMKKYNIDFNFEKDAAKEDLSVTDWACKHDPFSFWYSSFWNDMVDGKINMKDIFSIITANKEEVAKKMTSKNYNPSTNVYTTDSGVTISSGCRITKADLEKYKMPYFDNDTEEECEVMYL